MFHTHRRNARGVDIRAVYVILLEKLLALPVVQMNQLLLAFDVKGYGYPNDKRRKPATQPRPRRSFTGSANTADFDGVVTQQLRNTQCAEFQSLRLFVATAHKLPVAVLIRDGFHIPGTTTVRMGEGDVLAIIHATLVAYCGGQARTAAAYAEENFNIPRCTRSSIISTIIVFQSLWSLFTERRSDAAVDAAAVGICSLGSGYAEESLQTMMTITLLHEYFKSTHANNAHLCSFASWVEKTEYYGYEYTRFCQLRSKAHAECYLDANKQLARMHLFQQDITQLSMLPANTAAVIMTFSESKSLACHGFRLCIATPSLRYVICDEFSFGYLEEICNQFRRSTGTMHLKGLRDASTVIQNHLLMDKEEEEAPTSRPSQLTAIIQFLQQDMLSQWDEIDQKTLILLDWMAVMRVVATLQTLRHNYNELMQQPLATSSSFAPQQSSPPASPASQSSQLSAAQPASQSSQLSDAQPASQSSQPPLVDGSKIFQFAVLNYVFNDNFAAIALRCAPDFYDIQTDNFIILRANINHGTWVKNCNCNFGQRSMIIVRYKPTNRTISQQFVSDLKPLAKHILAGIMMVSAETLCVPNTQEAAIVSKLRFPPFCPPSKMKSYPPFVISVFNSLTDQQSNCNVLELEKYNHVGNYNSDGTPAPNTSTSILEEPEVVRLKSSSAAAANSAGNRASRYVARHMDAAEDVADSTTDAAPEEGVTCQPAEVTMVQQYIGTRGTGPYFKHILERMRSLPMEAGSRENSENDGTGRSEATSNGSDESSTSNSYGSDSETSISSDSCGTSNQRRRKPNTRRKKRKRTGTMCSYFCICCDC